MDVLNVYLDNDTPALFSYEILDVTGRLVRQKDLGVRGGMCTQGRGVPG